MTTGQLQATRHLCQLYEEVCPDEAQCIIYNEHQLNLLQRIGDKSLEGEILEKISQLYLNLASEKWDLLIRRFKGDVLNIYCSARDSSFKNIFL